MDKKESIWNKNLKISNEEKEAIDKYVRENIDTIPGDVKHDPSIEETILDVHKEELDEEVAILEKEIGELESEIINLEKEIQKLEKDEVNSDSDKEFQEIRNIKQTKINESEKKEKRIKEIEEYLKAMGRLTSATDSSKRNQN
ncbi:hypothetical protein KKA39_00435 [Patescibacteria group bacterium]|nr:hypothetical protein [Patescibacteria group bacterium]MBU1727774.1 hypothetical protein [Patescibacteria group bacterium]